MSQCLFCLHTNLDTICGPLHSPQCVAFSMIHSLPTPASPPLPLHFPPHHVSQYVWQLSGSPAQKRRWRLQIDGWFILHMFDTLDQWYCWCGYTKWKRIFYKKIQGATVKSERENWKTTLVVIFHRDIVCTWSLRKDDSVLTFMILFGKYRFSGWTSKCLAHLMLYVKAKIQPFNAFSVKHLLIDVFKGSYYIHSV